MEDIPDQPDLVVEYTKDTPEKFSGLVYSKEYKYHIWYLNGKIHREDGPAMIHGTGSKFWYVNNKCHKLDGPAAVWYTGTVYYFINGVFHTKEEFYNHPLVINVMSKTIMEF